MLKKINYPLSAMLVLGARLVVKGASIGDAVALAALCGLYAYTLYLASKIETPINDSVKNDLEQLRNAVQSLKIAKTFGK
jgi:hypothetical protein